jgi:hypothetical protein
MAVLGECCANVCGMMHAITALCSLRCRRAGYSWKGLVLCCALLLVGAQSIGICCHRLHG